MSKLVAVILSVWSFALQAQVTNDPNMMVMNQGYYGYMRTFAPDPEIEGRYFHGEEDFPLTLYLTDTRAPYEAEAANFNLLDQSIVLELEKGKYAILPENIDSARMQNGTLFINSKLIPNFEEKNILLLILAKGENATLAKSMDAFLIDPTYNEATNTGNRNFTIKTRNEYFLLTNQGGIYAVARNLKEMKALDQYGKLKQYVKKQKLNLKDEEDLVLLSGYFDSLL